MFLGRKTRWLLHAADGMGTGTGTAGSLLGSGIGSGRGLSTNRGENGKKAGLSEQILELPGTPPLPVGRLPARGRPIWGTPSTDPTRLR